MADTYPIATYPMPEPFSRALFEPVADWLKAKQLIDGTDYESMVAVDAMSSN